MRIDRKCEDCSKSDNQQNRIKLERYSEMLTNLRENSKYWISKLTLENEQLKKKIAQLEQGGKDEDVSIDSESDGVCKRSSIGDLYIKSITDRDPR